MTTPLEFAMGMDVLLPRVLSEVVLPNVTTRGLGNCAAWSEDGELAVRSGHRA